MLTKYQKTEIAKMRQVLLVVLAVIFCQTTFCFAQNGIPNGGIRVLRGSNYQVIVPRNVKSDPPEEAVSSPTTPRKPEERPATSSRTDILRVTEEEKFEPPVTQSISPQPLANPQPSIPRNFPAPETRMPAQAPVGIFDSGSPSWQTLPASDPPPAASVFSEPSPFPIRNPVSTPRELESPVAVQEPEPAPTVQHAIELNIAEEIIEPNPDEQAPVVTIPIEIASDQPTQEEATPQAANTFEHKIVAVQPVEKATPASAAFSEKKSEQFNAFGMLAMFVVGFGLAIGCLMIAGRSQRQQIPSEIKLVLQAGDWISKLQLAPNGTSATISPQVGTEEEGETTVVDLGDGPHIIPIGAHRTYADEQAEEAELHKKRTEEICKALFEENLNLQKSFASA